MHGYVYSGTYRKPPINLHFGKNMENLHISAISHPSWSLRACQALLLSLENSFLSGTFLNLYEAVLNEMLCEIQPNRYGAP